MGSFIGHAIPGSFFLLFGLWWLIHVVLEYTASLTSSSVTNSEPQRSWKRIPIRRLRRIPLEPLVKIIAAAIGLCSELGSVQWTLVNKNNEFQSPNKFAHASMYGFFALSGLIELLNFYKITHFSRELEHTMLAVAFAVEGMLFSFHLHERDMFDVRIHTILFIIIFLTALVILLEACIPRHQRELFMARTVLCLTQGTWFWEICFTIYGPHRWIGNAWKMPQNEVMLDTEVVTVNFCWHVLGWCGVMLIGCLIASCCCKGLSSDRLDNSSSEWHKRLRNGRFEINEEIGLLREYTGQTNNNETTDQE